MEFTGKHQAFIAAMYQVRLKEAYGEQGKKAFVHAARCYAERRGHRMAQRALRDGKDLTPATYEEYRELQAGHTIDFVSISPDFVMHVKKCEWADTYEELGLVEEGLLYCGNVDDSLSRGFNPDMEYHMKLRAEDSRCVHHIPNANFTKDTVLVPIDDDVQSLEYHAGDMFWAFAKSVEAIFLSGGVRIVAKVLDDFEKQFSKEEADRLMLYRNLDYEVWNGGTVK